ncbi:IS66 family transposase zinc-finger binding domain-containing protein, partial [Pseudomonas floridensis]
MISLPDDLPDDPVLLKQLLLEALNRQEESAQAYQTHIVDLKEQIKLLRDRLFGRKSEQTVEPDTPQLALFNEPESEPMPLVESPDEEAVAPTPRRGKRKPLSADLPRIEVIHELPEHELTCACGCRRHAIGEETSEQLDIVPMQIRVIKHIRKVYGCRGCEAAPVTADKPAQVIEKSMASP